jgi:hypothetical protein
MKSLARRELQETAFVVAVIGLIEPPTLWVWHPTHQECSP